jgi:hypothetical protein
MIASHLSIFAKHNKGDYPDRILIFRDGISEGQYLPVLTYEHDAVLKACQRIKGGYRPKILICVCAKRHSTRFFGEPRDIDSSGNLTSGLVVDRAVTHPYTTKGGWGLLGRLIMFVCWTKLELRPISFKRWSTRFALPLRGVPSRSRWFQSAISQVSPHLSCQ